jgi:hypothetical protein
LHVVEAEVAMFTPATSAQQNYLEILLNDRGFQTRAQRYAWLSLEIGRTIDYLDELSKAEASMLISKLKEEE